jgi:hypothetical protein
MRKYLLALSIATAAGTQSLQSGSIDGMPYYLLAASGGCSAAAPCSVVTYLSYMGETQANTASDARNYFGGSFAQQNPRTIVIAPMITQPQSTSVNWGGYDAITSPQQAQMVAVIQGVEQQMGNTVNTADSVVTGGSLGANGTQSALIAYGPKGTVQPGVFSAGLSFDAATYAAAGNAQDIAALCGVPLTAVHGTADTNQSVTYDQNLASAIDGNPACGNSFNFVPIQGAGHGTWSNPSAGYGLGVGSGTPLGWLSTELTAGSSATASTGTTVATATPATATSVTSASPSSLTTTAPTTTPASAAVSAAANEITPGTGSLTDCQGNVWTISASGSVQENGQWTPGGGGTSALSIQGCSVYGQDNGHDRNTVNSGGWFTLNGGAWQASQPPTTVTASPSSIPTTAGAAPAATATLPSTAAGSCPITGTASGGFHVANGQIIGPNGQPFTARGVNMADSDMGDASAAISLFPGLNFVRLAIYSYKDPSAYASFISTMTSRGTVVEIEHHVEANGATGGGGQGSIASGSWLASESAFYASVAKAYAANPYVWFGTTNEPPTQSGLSEWQQATYNAIRGQGNSSIIVLELAGWPGGWQSDMDPSVYASMTNVVWDTHFYGWVANYSTDQNTVNQALASEIAGAQTITSADGTVPALIGEYGPSTTGGSEDANATQTVQAVVNDGGSGTVGSAAWHWGMQDCCNNLNNGSVLTNPYGQTVALYINTDVVTPTACQTTARAEQQTAAIQQAMAQDPTTPAITVPTAANAIQAVQSSTTLAQRAQTVAAGQ